MSEPGSSSRAGRVAFTHPDFALYQLARFFIVTGLEMQSVAVGWQIYEITKRPIDLGLVGLAQFTPGILLFLISGHAADRLDRRKLLIGCYVGFFNGAASRALLPQIVPEEHFQNAVAWNGSVNQGGTILGPSLGGLIYAVSKGPSAVYTMAMVAAVGAIICMLRINLRAKARPREQFTLKSVLAGLHYIRKRKVVLGSISLDLFGVLLGGAVALLPVYAREILKTGPWGLGLLRSSPAIGAASMAILIAHRPLRNRVGATMLWCVAGFGTFTILFGISRSLILSMLSLLCVGAMDMVSGLTAQWLGAVPAVVLGGIGTLIVTALCAWSFPELRRVDEISSVKT